VAAMLRGEDVRRGGGETFAELQARVAETAERIVLAHPGQTILLVSHGAALRSLVAYALHASLPQMHRIAIGGNTAISVVEARHGALRLVSYNDTSHLDGDGFAIANAEELSGPGLAAEGKSE